jgi:hypothetical protein
MLNAPPDERCAIHNADSKNKAHQISLPHHLSADMPHTWLPALLELRKHHVAVNASIAVHGNVTIGASPHSAFRVVFDLSNQEKTRQKQPLGNDGRCNRLNVKVVSA